MISSFESYLKNGKVKRESPDLTEASSLLKGAKERLEVFKKFKLDEENASVLLENYYNSLREIAQALMSLKGFKPYSHEATISFVKEFYSSEFNEEFIIRFDRIRRLRNDSLYRAIKISSRDAEDCLELTKKMIDVGERVVR